MNLLKKKLSLIFLKIIQDILFSIKTLSSSLSKISNATLRLMTLDMNLDTRKEEEYVLMKLFKKNLDQSQKKLLNKLEEKFLVDH